MGGRWGRADGPIARADGRAADVKELLAGSRPVSDGHLAYHG